MKKRRFKLLETNKEQRFTILAIPCRKPFVVATDKVEAFKISSNTRDDNEEVRDITETFKRNNILFDYEFPEIKITKELREDILKHPEKYSTCDARIRMGMFRTDEEQEKYIQDSLKKSLPKDEAKVKKIGRKTDKK